MNPWPFVAAAYAVFFVGLAADAVLPGLRRRQLLAQLLGRSRREQARLTQREPT